MLWRANLLICAATESELRTAWFDKKPLNTHDGSDFVMQNDAVYLVSGVGIPATFARLPALAQRIRPARLLNIGIAGAYPEGGIAIGDIVIGQSEVYGDIGFELPDAPHFQPIRESTFGQRYAAPLMLEIPEAYQKQEAVLQESGLRVHRANGCTVNACTGTDATGRLRASLFNAQFETMEGAAVAQIGADLGIPVTEIRAISNIAAHRDMRPENIGIALTNLRRYLQLCLTEPSKPNEPTTP